jgi:hypothetical protein
MGEKEMERVCVYCGSREGGRPAYAEATRTLGAALVRRGLGLVYGGGGVGLMGVLADTVLAAGGEVTGVIPRALLAREVGKTGLTEQLVVGSMHQRKATMEVRADGFIALPGGLGTLEELCEVLTWAQLGLHGKPIGLLDVEGCYSSLVNWLDRAVDDGFVEPVHRSMLLVATDVEQLLDAMDSYKAPEVTKWLDPSMT